MKDIRLIMWSMCSNYIGLCNAADRGSFFQVKPLLEVTNNEEKLSQKEQELKAVNDKYEKMKLEREDIEHQYQQLAEERSMLAQQFRAEAELCAETEEVNVVHMVLCKYLHLYFLSLNLRCVKFSVS